MKSQALFAFSFANEINDLQKALKRAKKCPFDAISGAKTTYNEEFGAGYRIRTYDHQLGKLRLYH